MDLPENYKYTKDHEWLVVESESAEGANIKVGITEFAQSELGELVFVDLPKVGSNIEQGKSFCVVESTKAASDVYAPVSGTVREINSKLVDSPQLVNESPYTDGWLAVIEKVAPSALSDLMSAAEYAKLLQV